MNNFHFIITGAENENIRNYALASWQWQRIIYYIRKQQYLSSFELNNENDDEKVEEKNESQEYLHKEIVRC